MSEKLQDQIVALLLDDPELGLTFIKSNYIAQKIVEFMASQKVADSPLVLVTNKESG